MSYEAMYKLHEDPSGGSDAGFVLYHFVTSNCSQRARAALEEKGLRWESWHLDLSKRDNLERWYLAIQPTGTVPALTHGGKLVRESNEILWWLEDLAPEPSFAPTSGERAYVEGLLKRADEAQASMGAETYDRLLRGKRVYDAETLDKMEREHPLKAKTVAFLRDFMEDGEAFALRASSGREALGVFMGELEARLEDTGGWLNGEDFGIGDMSWMVNYARLKLTGFDLGGFPRVCDWGERVTARAGCARALAWKP